MPSISLTEVHSLPTHEAQRRISGLLTELKTKHADKISDVHETWQGNSAQFSFKLMGVKIEGELQVAAQSVTLQGKIPFAALPFRGMAERVIREHARELLDKA